MFTSSLPKRNTIYLWFVISSLLFLGAELLAKPSKPSAKAIVNKCIQRHGGGSRFNSIRDFYVKMDIKTFSEQGDIESLVHQYYRSPDKLRAEIHPLVDPPTKISWDGKNSWQLVKDKQEKSEDEKQIARIQESLKFIKLMILTNLLEKGSKLKYVREVTPKGKSYSFHVIMQANSKNEKIELYIKNDYTLLGAQFYWEGGKGLFKVFFDEQREFDGLYLPKYIRLYRENEMILKASLRLARFNALKNGDGFFSDLSEKPKMDKIRRGGRGGRNSR